MRRRSGLTLVAVLWFSALVLTFTLAGHGVLEAVRARLAHHKAQQAAAAMAVSGADYAQAMLRKGLWRPPHTFTSPSLDGGGWFAVQVSDHAVTSTGGFRSARFTVAREIR